MIYIVLSISYLLGSVNFAIIISKYKGIDIKSEGIAAILDHQMH